ncbi:hypothetical protein V6C27_07090 [Peptococcaceae bacterium 1198_IL3148]
MIEWIVTFVLSWIMFALLIDRQLLKYTLWGGITAIILQLIVDTSADAMGIYHVMAQLKLGGGSVFFTFGAVFTMGTIFVQFIPINRWLKILHILATATLFLGLEYLLVQRSIITYHNWGMGLSWLTNLVVFITITWLAETFNFNKKTNSF